MEEESRCNRGAKELLVEEMSRRDVGGTGKLGSLWWRQMALLLVLCCDLLCLWLTVGADV